MEGVDPDALKALVRYAYTGKSSITHSCYVDIYLLLAFPQFSEFNLILLDLKGLSQVAKKTNSENCEIAFTSAMPSRVKRRRTQLLCTQSEISRSFKPVQLLLDVCVFCVQQDTQEDGSHPSQKAKMQSPFLFQAMKFCGKTRTALERRKLLLHKVLTLKQTEKQLSEFTNICR